MRVGRLGGLGFLMMLVAFAPTKAQDSVDVTFRYSTTNAPPAPTVPGEFNGWNNTAWPMSYKGGTLWTRDARLQINPGTTTIPGAWEFKFYYSGASPWPNDPLDHHVNGSDNNNSFLITRDPTFYQVLPNQRNPLVRTNQPVISAYIYPKVGTTLDTGSIALTIDGSTRGSLGSYYNASTRQLVYVPPAPLTDGPHVLIISAASMAGGSNTDTVSFTTHGGFIQITTAGGYQTLDSVRTLTGAVGDTTIHKIFIVRNGTDTTAAPVAGGVYLVTVSLVGGLNTFMAVADSSGSLVTSSQVTFTRFINHTPNANISVSDGGGGTLQLLATGSTDPDSGQSSTLSYHWFVDPHNPSMISGVSGSTQPVITISRPTVQGEYYFALIATDVDGHSDTTRNYFAVGSAPPVAVPTLASVPEWVREGRMYEMFFKSHTAAGTINAATPDLDRIAAMGYSIIWVMPVMTNHYPMNNGTGTGYDIVDFYTVAPEYGTNQDFRNFVARAHELGMKVILDVTPNHLSAGHPLVADARAFRESSRYWTYFQHKMIPYTGPGLGQLPEAITPDGFVHIGAYGDELLNYNWADVDARQYMIDVYTWWVNTEGVDGFRLDSYWGPHVRANSPNGGEGEMGQPVRRALKHMSPGIHMLGEAMGVGYGTEVLYSDYAGAGGPGGVESAYDWNLKDEVHDPTFWTAGSATTINNLNSHLVNGSSTNGMGFLPGPDAYFLRFLENHDEDRISYLFGSGVDSTTAWRRTMPVSAAVNLAVGMPLVYAGQEVGRGYGIADYDQRRRGVITWTTFSAQLLMPHYQKLAQIRGQFRCFTSQQMVRTGISSTGTGPGGVYAFTRPSPGMNGIVVTNFDAVPNTVNVLLSGSGSPPNVQGVIDGVHYIATDLYNGNATQTVTFSSGAASLNVYLPAYGSAVFVLDTVAHTLVLPPLTLIGPEQTTLLPRAVGLDQNYPNPFNPSTAIRYQLPRDAAVSLKVFDVLGREIAALVNGNATAGSYTIVWDGRNAAGLQVGTGVYFYRLTAKELHGAQSVLVKKMLLLR